MDLDAYLERIGFSGVPRADFETLSALHRLHPENIAFENLSTLLGEPVPLAIEAVADKLVTRTRGGYCFEHNTLFQHALEAIGFELTPLAARVVWAPGYENPRTHMLLLVRLSRGRYLCDVGFGGATLTAPLEFVAEREQATPHETFRLRREGGEYELGIRLGDTWRAMYRFDLQPQRPIDYEALNHYVATHPASHFRRRLMAGLPLAGGRLALADNRFTRQEQGTVVEDRVIGTAGELGDLLAREFGISLPAHPALGAILQRLAAGAQD